MSNLGQFAGGLSGGLTGLAKDIREETSRQNDFNFRTKFQQEEQTFRRSLAEEQFEREQPLRDRQFALQQDQQKFQEVKFENQKKNEEFARDLQSESHALAMARGHWQLDAEKYQLVRQQFKPLFDEIGARGIEFNKKNDMLRQLKVDRNKETGKIIIKPGMPARAGETTKAQQDARLADLNRQINAQELAIAEYAQISRGKVDRMIKEFNGLNPANQISPTQGPPSTTPEEAGQKLTQAMSSAGIDPLRMDEVISALASTQGPQRPQEATLVEETGAAPSVQERIDRIRGEQPPAKKAPEVKIQVDVNAPEAVIQEFSQELEAKAREEELEEEGVGTLLKGAARDVQLESRLPGLTRKAGLEKIQKRAAALSTIESLTEKQRKQFKQDLDTLHGFIQQLDPSPEKERLLNDLKTGNMGRIFRTDLFKMAETEIESTELSPAAKELFGGKTPSQKEVKALLEKQRKEAGIKTGPSVGEKIVGSLKSLADSFPSDREIKGFFKDISKQDLKPLEDSPETDPLLLELNELGKKKKKSREERNRVFQLLFRLGQLQSARQ